MIGEALQIAFRAGLAPSEFWTCTPFATRLLLEARGEEIEAERRDLLWQVWHGEALARMKRLPRLDGLLKPARKRVRARTPEEIDAVLFAAEPKAIEHG